MFATAVRCCLFVGVICFIALVSSPHSVLRIKNRACLLATCAARDEHIIHSRNRERLFTAVHRMLSMLLDYEFMHLKILKICSEKVQSRHKQIGMAMTQ